MAVPVQRVGGGVQTHVLQSALEPQGKLVPDHWRELHIAERHLEHGSPPSAAILAIDLDQFHDGVDRTELRVLRSSQCNFVKSFSELIFLRLGDGEQNALVDVIVQGFDVVPAEDHLQVNLGRRLN